MGRGGEVWGLISPHPVSEPSLWNPAPREPDQPPLLPPKKEKMKRKVRPAMPRALTSGWGWGCRVGVGAGRLITTIGDICGAVPLCQTLISCLMWRKPSQMEVDIIPHFTEEETEADRVACQGHKPLRRQRQDLNPGTLAPES